MCLQEALIRESSLSQSQRRTCLLAIFLDQASILMKHFSPTCTSLMRRLNIFARNSLSYPSFFVKWRRLPSWQRDSLAPFFFCGSPRQSLPRIDRREPLPLISIRGVLPILGAIKFSFKKISNIVEPLWRKETG